MVTYAVCLYVSRNTYLYRDKERSYVLRAALQSRRPASLWLWHQRHSSSTDTLQIGQLRTGVQTLWVSTASFGPTSPQAHEGALIILLHAANHPAADVGVGGFGGGGCGGCFGIMFRSGGGCGGGTTRGASRCCTSDAVLKRTPLAAVPERMRHLALIPLHCQCLPFHDIGPPS